MFCESDKRSCALLTIIAHTKMVELHWLVDRQLLEIWRWLNKQTLLTREKSNKSKWHLGLFFSFHCNITSSSLLFSVFFSPTLFLCSHLIFHDTAASLSAPTRSRLKFFFRFWGCCLWRNHQWFAVFFFVFFSYTLCLTACCDSSDWKRGEKKKKFDAFNRGKTSLCWILGI